MFVQKHQLLASHSIGNRSKFLYAESSRAWFFDCLYSFSSLIEADNCLGNKNRYTIKVLLYTLIQ